MESIGKLILDTRKSKGITQEELAESAKVNLRTIQRIENNENEPRGKTLIMICEALDLDPDLLLSSNNLSAQKSTSETLIKFFFLVIINFAIVFILGFMTIGSGANFNSTMGGIIIGFLLGFFVIFFTQNLNRTERFLKYGLGTLLYLLMAIILHKFPTILLSGLLFAGVLFLGVLFYGEKLLKKPA